MINLHEIHDIWDRLTSSLWFVPAAMAIGAVFLAATMTALDSAIDSDTVRYLPFVYSGDAPGARAVLSTIAGSMITIAGVVFSLTIIALQLASSQYGPRLLRTFMRDLGNQVVLGTFISTFLYCILLLRVVGSGGDESFVPHLAVALAVVLAVVSLAVLVYFIDHVAQSMHASVIAENVGRELDSTITRLFPEMTGESAPFGTPPTLPDDFDQFATTIEAQHGGYIRFINESVLLSVARQHNVLTQIISRPGDFVIRGDPLMCVGLSPDLPEQVITQFREAFAMGAQRTALQDVGFLMDQLVEMALRALSPGTTDPFTAVNCLDHLGTALAMLVERENPPVCRADAVGQLRLFKKPVTSSDLIRRTLGPIRRHSCGELMVNLRVLTVIASVARRATRAEDRQATLDEASQLEERLERSRLTKTELSECAREMKRIRKYCQVDNEDHAVPYDDS